MLIKITYKNDNIVEYSDFSNWDKLEKDKIIKIYCLHNNLTSLPELKEYKQLYYLDCINNNLTSLPEKYKLSKIIYI